MNIATRPCLECALPVRSDLPRFGLQIMERFAKQPDERVSVTAER